MPTALLQQLATLDATLVVIDTPPHTAVTLPTIAAVATALLLPCRPTAFDLATHGLPSAPVRLGERRAYARAVASGRAVRGMVGIRVYAQHGINTYPGVSSEGWCV